MGAIGGQRRPSPREGTHQSRSVVLLSSKTALEEPFTAAEGGIVMGLIGRPGTAAVAGRNVRSCTLVILFS